MKCKQGEMAFIKKALRPVNIGKIVTCKEMLGYFIRGEELMYNGEKWMAVDTDHIWVVTNPNGIETMYGSSIEALIPDTWMTPIKGDKLDSGEDTAISKQKHDTMDA